MSLTIHDRHLVDRYLQGELSGIELDDFKNRLSADKGFNHEVDLQKIIYSGIQLAREEQLEKKILASVKYRKPTIPFALKLTITFLVVTVFIISLWFYAGKDFNDTVQHRPWYSFLKKEMKTEKNKSNSKSKGDEVTKSNANAIKIKEDVSDSINAQQSPTVESEELNKPVDTTDMKNTEEIVVKQDQLLISANVPVIDKSTNEKQNTDNSLTADAAQKMNPAADLPEPETKAKDYEVEFWVSPINYKGYKMSKNKIILFGIEEPDAVKLYRVNDAIYMTYLKNYYELEPNYDFKPYQKIKETDIPPSIK